MRDFLAGEDVTLSIELLGSDGSLLVASAATYRVLNHEGVVVVEETAVPGFIAEASEVSITIPAAINEIAIPTDPALVKPRSTETRSVQLLVTTDTGRVLIEEIYQISLIERLLVPYRSFQTYAGAVMVASGLTDLANWKAASREDRIAALFEARDNLCRLGYRFNPSDVPDWQSRIQWDFQVTQLGDYTASNYAGLPSVFKEALCKAQVLEADFLLGGGAMGSRIAGLTMETIGEVSQRYRTTQPARYPVCTRALQVLSGYIIFGRQLARG